MSTADSSDGLLRIVVIVLGVVILFPLLMMVFAMPMMGMMGWWWDGGMMGRFSPLWGVGMLVLWLAILLTIGYVLYRGLVGRVGAGATGDPALEELRMAYARGDVSDEEYEERRERLQRGE